MPTLHWGEHEIRSASTPRTVMRRALATVQRDDVEAAEEETGVPRRLIEMWCDEASIPHANARPQSLYGNGSHGNGLHGDGQRGEPQLLDVERTVKRERGEAFVSVYEHRTGQFRLSAGAIALMEVEPGTPLTFAQDDGDSRTHIYIGVQDTAAGAQCKVRRMAHALGFNSCALARILGLYDTPRTRRLIIEREPVRQDGVTLWKTLLLAEDAEVSA